MPGMGTFADLLDVWRLGTPPAFCGGRLLVRHRGETVVDVTVGDAVGYADDGLPLPPGRRAPLRRDAVFDLASVTKLFTAATLLTVLEDRGHDVDTPLGAVLPELADPAWHHVTTRHLLSHTAGFAPTWRGWRDLALPAARAQAWREVTAMTPQHPPGSVHDYSCVGYLLAGRVVEQLTGTDLATAVRGTVLTPLGMHDTGYGPYPDVERVAATELQTDPPRGMVRGQVHDEAAWALGGVAGNAGLFATARDLMLFAELLRTGGRHGSRRVLSARTVELMTTDQRPAGVAAPYGQALGPRLGDAENAGELAPGSIGHTGFTGTWLLVVPGRELSLVLLTNRVHPSRHWSEPSALRRAVAHLVASAVEGEREW